MGLVWINSISFKRKKEMLAIKEVLKLSHICHLLHNAIYLDLNLNILMTLKVIIVYFCMNIVTSTKIIRSQNLSTTKDMNKTAV